MLPSLRKNYLATLRKICSHYGLIPRSIQIPLCYTRTKDPQFEGRFAKVWKGEHKGMEVAVRVLKAFATSDPVKIERVGFPVCRRTLVDWLVPTTQRFCKKVMTWKALRHQNVLPLLGVIMSEHAMVSEWMVNENITRFIKTDRDANRFKLVGFCSTVDRTCR